MTTSSQDYHHLQLEILALQRLPPAEQAVLPPASRVKKPTNMLSVVDASQWVGCAGELLELYVKGNFVAVLDHLLTQTLLCISTKVSCYYSKRGRRWRFVNTIGIYPNNSNLFLS